MQSHLIYGNHYWTLKKHHNALDISQWSTQHSEYNAPTINTLQQIMVCALVNQQQINLVNDEIADDIHYVISLTCY